MTGPAPVMAIMPLGLVGDPGITLMLLVKGSSPSSLGTVALRVWALAYQGG